MPADLQSAAEALSVSPSRSSSHGASPPPWSTSRRYSSRLLRRPARHSPARSGSFSFAGQVWTSARLLAEQTVKAYLRLPLWQRIAVLCVAATGWAVIILSVVYSHALFEWLGPVSRSWRQMTGGWLIVVLMVFLTSVPPLIGYSTASTIAGFIYGFPLGWPIAAVGSVAGSLCAFLASRTIFSAYVDRLVGQDRRFQALGHVLKREGLLYLTAIRFCPLPFSLSNGFLATIPSITPLSFTIATAIASLKLLIHTFIGSRLAILAENGSGMTLADKLVNYVSIAIFSLLGLAVGLVIYRRTMAHAGELAREDAMNENGDSDFEDSGSSLIDPEDAAALMSDDDISLWEAQRSQYRDSVDEADADHKAHRSEDGRDQSSSAPT